MRRPQTPAPAGRERTKSPNQAHGTGTVGDDRNKKQFFNDKKPLQLSVSYHMSTTLMGKDIIVTHC